MPPHPSCAKDRPCVILVAVERQQSGDIVVVALPVTHRPPNDARLAVEMSQAVRRQLGLDVERSWGMKRTSSCGRVMICAKSLAAMSFITVLTAALLQ
jgi:hypothetical protein